jgi:hypothetical protein
MMDPTQAQLNSHVDVCTLRYEMLCARIKRLENIMLGVSGIMLTSMAGIIFTSLK